MAKGFTLNQIADYLRTDKGYTLECAIRAGVQRRIKYMAGQEMDGSGGRPVYERFTQEEASRILQEAYRRRGLAEEERQRRGARKAPEHLRVQSGRRPSPEED